MAKQWPSLFNIQNNQHSTLFMQLLVESVSKITAESLSLLLILPVLYTVHVESCSSDIVVDVVYLCLHEWNLKFINCAISVQHFFLYSKSWKLAVYQCMFKIFFYIILKTNEADSQKFTSWYWILDKCRTPRFWNPGTSSYNTSSYSVYSD